MKKFIAVLLAVLMSFSLGCATMQPAPPAPECKDAIIVNSEFASVGKFAVEEAWAILLVTKRVPRTLLLEIAVKAKAAVEIGEVRGVLLAFSGSGMMPPEYTAVVIPVINVLEVYKMPTLHKCDQDFLLKMMDDLILLSGGVK